jgi:probable O-glycosylation ligase (exosortase A-associated)
VEYGKILFMVVLATLVIDRLSQVRLIAVMIVVCLGYVAWELNYLYVFRGRLDLYHYGYGGLDNNGAGLMLAMGLPFAYAFGVRAPRLWQRLLAVIGGVLLMHCIMMSYSRGAMVAGIIGLGWLILHNRSRVQMVAAVLVVAVSIGVLAGPEVQQRFLSTRSYQQDNSAQARFDSWAAAWQIAWENPLAGKGVRNSNQYTENYGADKFGRTVHSQYLQIAADSGIPAMLIYMAMLSLAILNFGRARRMCLDYIDQLTPRTGGFNPQWSQMAEIILACQTALLIFSIGAVFLSLEVFELPWLLMMLGGVLPGIVQRRLGLDDREPAAPRQPLPRPAPANLPPAPAGGLTTP